LPSIIIHKLIQKWRPKIIFVSSIGFNLLAITTRNTPVDKVKNIFSSSQTRVYKVICITKDHWRKITVRNYIQLLEKKKQIYLWEIKCDFIL